MKWHILRIFYIILSVRFLMYGVVEWVSFGLRFGSDIVLYGKRMKSC